MTLWDQFLKLLVKLQTFSDLLSFFMATVRIKMMTLIPPPPPSPVFQHLCSSKFMARYHKQFPPTLSPPRKTSSLGNLFSCNRKTNTQYLHQHTNKQFSILARISLSKKFPSMKSLFLKKIIHTLRAQRLHETS